MSLEHISQRLVAAPQGVPTHLAVIMDGNRRWARVRGLKTESGWREGEERLYELVRMAVRRGVSVLSVFAFSSENWRRPQSEIRTLMQQLGSAAGRRRQQLLDNGVQVHFIGSRQQLPASEVRAMHRLEQATAKLPEPRLQLVIAVDYGGQWDLLQAMRRTLADVEAGVLAADHLQEADLARRLSLAELPPVDLLIRTGGEQRISNFLIWHLAYAELYFTGCLWPDFSNRESACALEFYRGRERRFGADGDEYGACEAAEKEG